MDLLWPGSLLLVLFIPLMIAAYIWILRKRRKFTVRYSSLSLVREAAAHQSRWKRHVPFAFFMLGSASLIGATARPVSVTGVPTDQTVIILAMDVSRSMCSTDIEPNRLAAAQAAAVSFVERQKTGTRIGIVAFSGFAELVQAPTRDQAVLTDAINGLSTGRRTAIGSGILKSIDAIAEVNTYVAPSTRADRPNLNPTPVPNGAYAPDIIVLLTDGATNAGPPPVDAAQQAADRGLRVYTIGFGTAKGAEMVPCGAQLVGREPQGGGFFGGGGGGFRRGIDEETLKKVAALTDGEYYSAESSGELVEVFNNLPTYSIMRYETTEISFVFAALGALLAMLAIGLSWRWHAI